MLSTSLIFLGIYVAALFLLVRTTLKTESTSRDFITANRSLGPLAVAASATVGVLDSTSVLVLFGGVLLFGGSSVGIWLAYIGATILIALLAPSFYRIVRDNDVFTMTDFFRTRIGACTEKAFLIISILFSIGLIAVIYSINLTLFERFLGMGTVGATLISFIITLSYVLLGGFRALVRTDILQFAVMLVLLLTAVVLFPGAEQSVSMEPVGSWFGAAFLMLAPVAFFQNMIKPSAWMPVIGARDERVAKRGMWLAVVLNAVLIVPILAISFSYAGLFPNAIPTDVLFDALGVALPAFMTPLIFVALFAALMSSLDSILFFAAANTVHNFLPKRVTKTKERLYIQVAVVGISLLTVLLATLVPDFITLALSITPLMGVPAIPFLVSFFWSFNDIDKATAFGCAAGVAIFAYLFINPPSAYIWNILPTLTSGTVFAISVLATKFRHFGRAS